MIISYIKAARYEDSDLLMAAYNNDWKKIDKVVLIIVARIQKRLDWKESLKGEYHVY